MIAFAREYSSEQPEQPAWHEGFMKLLPAIREQLRFALRNLSRDERAEAMAECIASIAIEYAKLHERGKLDVAFVSSLVGYAVKRYSAGRRVGSRLNANDITSAYAQRQRGFRVRSLDQRAPSGEWRETLVEDRRSTPAEVATARLDIADWLEQLPRMKRGIAETLATGESTKQTASQFAVTPGRVSQLRRELEIDWHQYQGEPLLCA
jgi:hypothetical protein